ncbi:MAG: hypothetical protein ACRETA_00635, partial [Gammaproteobacteria bacterium]
MNKRALVLLTVLAVLLTACVKGNNSTTNTNPNQTTSFQATFTPLSGIGPFPNDLYFNGSTSGTLNIPVTGDPSSPANGTIVAMNHLDGFGTQAVINGYFNMPLAATSLNASDIIVFKVSSDPQTKAVNPPSPGGTGAAPQLLTQGADCSSSATDYMVGVSAATDSGGTVLN